MAVLLIDPGFHAIGVAVYSVEADTILDIDALILDKKVYAKDKKLNGSSAADAHFIESAIEFLNESDLYFVIDWVALELPHGGQNFRSVKMLALISGAIIGWAVAKDKPIKYYTPGFNKKCATGDSRASKELMELAVRQKWSLVDLDGIEDKAVEHICDAVALVFAAKAKGDIKVGDSSDDK